MYDLEEFSVIEGLIGEYLLRPGSPEIANRYFSVYQNLQNGHVLESDLHDIQMALELFIPMYSGQPEMRAAIVNALVKTRALLQNKTPAVGGGSAVPA